MEDFFFKGAKTSSFQTKINEREISFTPRSYQTTTAIPRITRVAPLVKPKKTKNPGDTQSLIIHRQTYQISSFRHHGSNTQTGRPKTIVAGRERKNAPTSAHLLTKTNGWGKLWRWKGGLRMENSTPPLNYWTPPRSPLIILLGGRENYLPVLLLE